MNEKEFVTFKCPYCGVEVQSGDQHADKIERKKLRDTPTILVTCRITREFPVNTP